jgi:hypothetical protein
MGQWLPARDSSELPAAFPIQIINIDWNLNQWQSVKSLSKVWFLLIRVSFRLCKALARQVRRLLRDHLIRVYLCPSAVECQSLLTSAATGKFGSVKSILCSFVTIDGFSTEGNCCARGRARSVRAGEFASICEIRVEGLASFLIRAN